MSGFLKLPTDLACEIVGKWLCLKDVVRLDSAFCHKEMRNVLHESVFQSPCCVVAIADPLSFMVPPIVKWVSIKCIRLRTLHVTSGVGLHGCEEYLKRYGDTVNSADFTHCSRDSAPLLTLVGRYCTNLCVLVTFYCDLSPCVDILKSCAWQRSIDISSRSHGYDCTHLDFQTKHHLHHLHICSIKLDCNSCDPLCVQRLRLANMTHTHWHTFVNLRSFGFYYNSRLNDANLLVQICTMCPWIVNLAVSGYDKLTDEMVVPAIPALKQLRSFNCECATDLTDHAVNTLIAHHRRTLKAVYLLDCASVSTSAKTRLLKELRHTLSCDVWDDINYSLMRNLTTLIMNFSSEEGWNGVQQHCHSLQSLHLVPPLFRSAVDSHIIVEKGNLQALRTVYTASGNVHNLRLQLPSVCVIEEEDEKWYDLFELPI